MKRRLAVLAASAVLAAAAFGTGPARADDPDGAYCPPTATTGSVTYTSPVTTTLAPHAFTMSINTVCTGAPDETGPYVFSMSGTGVESCAAIDPTAPHGGSVSGAGPEGAISGTFTYLKVGLHYVVSMQFTMGGEEHTGQFWMDVFPPVCPYTTAALIGHGVVADVGAG